MAATKKSRDQIINESTGTFKSSNNITAAEARNMVFSVMEPQAFCNGRLTLESGVPVSTSDQTAKTSVYFTPYLGNCIGVFDGTSWTLRTFSELTLALGTLTSGLPYDVFVYDNAGTLTLESLAWTNGTTRATALVLQDGVYCKTGALTRRYLGTFYTTATTTTEDSKDKRFLWNAYNQEPRVLQISSSSSHTYATASFRAWNNSSAVRFQWITGLGPPHIEVNVQAEANGNATGRFIVGVGLDSTTVEYSPGGTPIRYDATFASSPETASGGGGGAVLASDLTIGFHYLQVLEFGVTGTTTFPTVRLAGILQC